ncbi:reverse transcriptase domain-containing protein [Tanacetum coccineum]
MADNRTMAQMLQAPIEGYEDAIVIPPINANNFELKQPLINLVQSNKFTGRQDPHNHLRFFNKVTSTFRHPEVPNTSIKLLLFPFSLDGEARDWLDKEPPRSILTWDDLVSKFINQFFPPSKTTYLRNKITNFFQEPNETFNEAWERFKGLLRQCPHHGFSELHQLDTFYNSLNSNDQDALDSAAGGNFLDKMPQEGLAIIESKSKVRYSRSRANDSRVSTDAPLSTSSPSNNSFDMQQIAASLEDKMTIKMKQMMNEMKALVVTTPAPVKAVEEVCVTCGSNHHFNHCPLTRGGNDFPVFHDNIQQFQQTAAVGNFLQRNQPSNLASQMKPPGFNQPNVQNNQNRYQGNNFNSNQNRGGNFNHQNNQGQVFQPPTNQPPVYQVPPYQAPTPQIHSNHQDLVLFADSGACINLLPQFYLQTLIDLYEETLTLRVGKDELVYYAYKSEKNKERNFVHAISIIDFLKDDRCPSYSLHTYFIEEQKLEAYLDTPGIDLNLSPTFEVSNSNPTSPTLTGEKVCSWKTPMFFSLVRFVWKMMTRIAIRKKIICLLATFLNKKPKPLSQEVEEIKEKEDEVSSDVPINTIVMPIRITFDNPIDFNDHFSKPKDLKKDLTISFDSTTKSSILPHPLLDSDSPFTAELSASVTLNSLGNEDKVFKPGILVYHAIHDKNLVTLEKKNISSGTLLVFKEPSFLLPQPEPPDECLKNVVLNEDFYQNKKTFTLNVEDVNTFAIIIWTFLPFFTYSEESPLIFSFRSENFVFDPGIITFHNPVAVSICSPKGQLNSGIESSLRLGDKKQAASWEFTPCLSFLFSFYFLKCCVERDLYSF